MKTLSFADFCATRRPVDDLSLVPELAESFEGGEDMRPGLLYLPYGYPLYIEGPDATAKSDEAYLLTIGNSGWTAGTPAELEPELYAFYLTEVADPHDPSWNACFDSAPENRYFGSKACEIRVACVAAADDAAPTEATTAKPGPFARPEARPLPEAVPFVLAFRIAFGLVVENGYSLLDDDCFDEQDPNEVRCQFDQALSETAQKFTGIYLPGPLDAERMGQLADVVLETWTALNEFLIETTDAHLTDEEAPHPEDAPGYVEFPRGEFPPSANVGPTR